jgi:hypothetical protein
MKYTAFLLVFAAHASTFLITDNGGIPSVTEPDQTGSYYLFSPSCSLNLCTFWVAKEMWEMGWGPLVPSAGTYWPAVNVYDSTDTSVLETITLNYTSIQPGGAFGPSTYAVQYNSTPGRQPIAGAPDLIQSGQIQPAFEVPWIDGSFDTVEFQANNAVAQSNLLAPTPSPDPSSGSLILVGLLACYARRRRNARSASPISGQNRGSGAGCGGSTVEKT